MNCVNSLFKPVCWYSHKPMPDVVCLDSMVTSSTLSWVHPNEELVPVQLWQDKTLPKGSVLYQDVLWFISPATEMKKTKTQTTTQTRNRAKKANKQKTCMQAKIASQNEKDLSICSCTACCLPKFWFWGCIWMHRSSLYLPYSLLPHLLSLGFVNLHGRWRIRHKDMIISLMSQHSNVTHGHVVLLPQLSTVRLGGCYLWRFVNSWQIDHNADEFIPNLLKFAYTVTAWLPNQTTSFYGWF